MDKPPLKLLAKLVEARKRVTIIGKDAKNTHQKYDYASEKAIKLAFRPVLDDLGLFLQFDVTGVEYVGPIVRVAISYTWFDSESGESLCGTFSGSGQARDDKGVYAAITGAIKYFLTTNLLVPTGDDPESDKFERHDESERPEPRDPDAPHKPSGVRGPYPAKYKFDCICGNTHAAQTPQLYWETGTNAVGKKTYGQAAVECFKHQWGEPA